MIVFIVLAIVGLAAILIGRYLPTSDEEKWKGENPAARFILGPPGYYRSTMIGAGYLLIVLGLVGSVWRIFF